MWFTSLFRRPKQSRKRARVGRTANLASPGDQGRTDLLTVPQQEVSHLFGQEQEADGLMAETLMAGTRRVPALGSDLMGGAALDPVFAAGP